ncbi:putative inactive receptor kinase [Camellia lanceoleosa]|uniref:Inactive receptor kinase n=1 Tax=Camellia lanceoleosa TaxID=1840588 RepID=A0ACC0HUZ4_9ERIC|nr:putative inactive receptor kinase [Camellia lanceoleosa]
MMDRVLPTCLLVSVLLFLFVMARSEEEEVKQALVRFMERLAPGNAVIGQTFGWDVNTDPCSGKWQGVICDSPSQSVKMIVLDERNLTGVLDALSLCTTSSLLVLSLNDNGIGGDIPNEISNCQNLTHLYLSGNRFSGNLPLSLPQLNNLKRLDLSKNALSGQVPPNLSKVSGLLSFFVQDNQLSGEIPKFDFSNLAQFNVSNNNFSGAIPDVKGRFNTSSFLDYAIIGFIVVVFNVALKLCKKKRRAVDKTGVEDGRELHDNSNNKISDTSSEFKTGEFAYRSEYSITSFENEAAASPLVVLSSPMVNGLKFEELLQAPAKLVGRGKHGSLYKVILDGGVILAVKRIKDCGIQKEDFKKRMERIDQEKHPNVLQALAYYCSKQERLLVYEFQQNGCLFNLLHDRVLPTCVLVAVLLFLFVMARSEEEEVKQALVRFMEKLAPGNAVIGQTFGWDVNTDPCSGKWQGVTCDSQSQSVKRIVLDERNLTGVLDALSLCTTSSLLVLSLNDNGIGGDMPNEISNCQNLTHLYLSGNRFSGNLPLSLPQLSNLKRLDLSKNALSGQVPPNLSKVSGLLSFLVQDNQLSGEIPKFDFSNLAQFNVSNNNFSGAIPDVKGRFDTSSFLGNPGLCGLPLSDLCPLSPPAKKSSTKQFLVYSGYAIIGFIVVVFIVALKLSKKKRRAVDKTGVEKERELHDNSNKISGTLSEFKTGEFAYRSEYSITSFENGTAASPLVVLSSPVVNGLKFEELLQAPAVLVGRGKHGSLYKVILDGGVTLAVKRIKDCRIQKDDFKKRMERIDQVKHPKVLQALAYYCSKQERLLVYEFQQNGSLFNLLHGSQNSQLFDWGSRIRIAAITAQALAFMHDELCDDGIAHGNLKSSKILLDKDMDPRISEYGLMVVENPQDQSPLLSQTKNSFKDNDPNGGRAFSTFKVDVYGFGVILLEMLTGKLVQNNGFDLVNWVNSVVREEWTVEVFDRTLISEGASEERMVNLLQVALKCINPSPDARPSINQVATMINIIKEEEEKSLSFEP